MPTTADIPSISKCDCSLELLRLDPPDRRGRRWSRCGGVLCCVLSSVSVGELLQSERSDPLPEAWCVAKLCTDTSTQCFRSKFTGPNCTLQMICHKSQGRENVSPYVIQQSALRGLQSDWHHCWSPIVFLLIILSSSSVYFSAKICDCAAKNVRPKVNKIGR